MTMNTTGAWGLAALLAVALTGCGDNGVAGDPPVLQVVDGTVSLAATPDRPSAAYFTVEGGTAPVQLVAVTADLAQRTEMHESVKENGMVSMKPITAVDVPARGEVAFKRGGKHVMVWGINPAAVKAGKLPMVFIFTNNDRIIVDMKIEQAVPAGTEAAKADEHAGH